MNFNLKFVSVLTVLAAAPIINAQNDGSATPRQTPPPMVVKTPAPTQKLSETLSKNIETLGRNDEVSRERREQSYAKLLEGQRYLWMMRQRSQQNTNLARLAKLAFQKAVELNPNLAEGYTALAELTLSVPPNDINEAISLASLAVRIDNDNYGGHRILSRLYTIKSRLNDGVLDDAFAQKAIREWKEVTRLDPRSAEAWAFLSEFYRLQNKSDDRITSLKNWVGSALPTETRFYRTILGNQENLSPEAASVKLGQALLDADRIAEAVEVLNQAVADDPENAESLDLLSRALEKADSKTAATAIQSLQQAIYANPESVSLIMLLAKVQARTGNLAEAAKFLNVTINKLVEKDKNTAAVLELSLGDLYKNADRIDEAVTAYQKALTIAGIDKDTLATDDQREFATSVFERIIQIYKQANREADAKKAIAASRVVLGDEDLFSDRQLIALYREAGKKQEALQAIQAARVRFPSDTGLLRQEASALAQLGRVDEGVALVKLLIGKKNAGPLSAGNDDFSNYLFISMLYSDSKRGKDAIDAANQALQIAVTDERKQIARLTLATAQQSAGDFKGAEATLRGILSDSPNNPIALNNLGYFLVERNEKLDEALKFIQAALKTDPENSSYLDSLGWAYFKMGKLDLAEENLKKALKSDPTSATIHEHLGDVYQKQGKAETARQSWQKALDLSGDPDQIAALKLKLNKKTTK
ncbi:MAG: tetratricopeptide repeat protein [Acidobacteria bacterium]|nr:tetratricopeptide repeat protein [Acidobacteriota bacterium]